MKFTLVIYAAPYSSQAAQTALYFARALLSQGHQIYRIFFFGDGVHNANSLAVVAQDDLHVQRAWDKLIRENSLDSVVCVTSAIKRGVLDAAEAKRYNQKTVSLLDSTEIAGLGQLVDATTNSDRLVNFG